MAVASSQQQNRVEDLAVQLVENWGGDSVDEALRRAEKAPSSTDPLEFPRCSHCGSKKVISKPGHQELAEKVETPAKCGECGSHLSSDEIDPAPADVLGDLRGKIATAGEAAAQLATAVHVSHLHKNRHTSVGMRGRRQLAARFETSWGADRETSITFQTLDEEAVVKTRSPTIAKTLLKRSDVDIRAVFSPGEGWVTHLRRVLAEDAPVDGVEATIPKGALLVKAESRLGSSDSLIITLPSGDRGER